MSQLGTKAGIVGDKVEGAPKGKSGGGSGRLFVSLVLLLLFEADAAAAAAAAAQRSFCRSAIRERMPPPPPPQLAPFPPPPPPSLCLIGAGAASFDSPLGDFLEGCGGGGGRGRGEAGREGDVEGGLSPPSSAFSRMTLPPMPVPPPPPSPSSASSSSTISISAGTMDGYWPSCSFPIAEGTRRFVFTLHCESSPQSRCFRLGVSVMLPMRLHSTLAGVRSVPRFC